MLTLLNLTKVYVLIFCESMFIAKILGTDISVLYMEKSETSLDIRNPDLRTLLPEVEGYVVRRESLSFIKVLPA